LNDRIRFHPLVARDLDAIARWILDYAGSDAAARKLVECSATIKLSTRSHPDCRATLEIEAAIATLKTTPHKGSFRDEIAPGLSATPAGWKAVIAFVVDDDQRDVLIYAVTYGGADWAMRSSARSR